MNYYKTGTLQLQGNNVQSAKDKLRAAMDGGKTNCDLNDESEDVVSDRHVVVPALSINGFRSIDCNQYNQ